MGVDVPMPLRGAFQAIFSVVPQRVGTLVSVEIPSAEGPRHCGQFSRLQYQRDQYYKSE